MRKLAIALLCLLAGAATAHSQSEGPLRLARTYPLPGVTGRFDHFAFDAQGQRLFIAATGNHSVEILNVKTGKVTESLTGLGKPHGLAWVAESGRLFVSDGSLAVLKVYGGLPFAEVASLKLSEDADDMVYDPGTRLLYVGHGTGEAAATGQVAVVDTTTLKVIANLPAAAHPEALEIDNAAKRIYVNIADAGEILTVDSATHSITSRWKLTRAKDNVPVALDAEDGLLFVGCRAPAKLVAIDARSGREVADLPAASGSDDLFYDGASRRAYLIAGSGIVNVYQVSRSRALSSMGEIKTAPGAKTGLLVSDRQTLYVGVPGANGQDSEIRAYSTK